MANDIEVELSIEIDEKKLKRGADKAFKGVEKRGKSAGEKTGASFSEGFANGATAIVAAGAAIFGFVRSAKSAIDASARQQEAINRLNTSLKLTGQFSEGASQSFQNYASSLQLVTRYGDEVILENAALIQSLGNLSGDSLKQATKAALDLSAALGIDLASASTLVGKAAAGEVGSFSRYGLIIKKGADNAETFARALEKINDQFGGAAESQLNTFAGAVDQVQNSFGDLLERLGDIITKSPEVIGFLKSVRVGLDSIFPSIDRFGALPQTVKELREEEAALQAQIKDQRGIFTQLIGDESQREQILADTQALSDRLKLVRQEINAINERTTKESKTEVLSATDGMLAGWNSLTDGIKTSQAQINDSFKAMAKTARNTFATGVGQAFASFGQSLVNGDNAMKAFAKSMIGTIGDVAIQLGTSFILQGIAHSLNPLTPGLGGPMIAAGAALATFGGALKAFAGGGAPTASATSGGGVMASGGMDVGTESATLADETEEREEPRTGINVTIQGDVLDSDESGLRIVKLIQDAFDTKGATIVGMA